MKHILLVAYHFPPILGSSGVQRTLQFVRHLPTGGWQPLVVSVDPRAYGGVDNTSMAEVLPGVPVTRAFALDSARHFGIWGRYLGWTAFPDRWVTWWPAGVVACLRLVRRYRPKVLWSTFPVATAHLIGLTVQRLTGLPWIADFRDPMVQPSHRLPPLRGLLWRRLEAAVVGNASRCVFATSSMLADYAARYPNQGSSTWSVIENGYEEEAFTAAERHCEQRTRAAEGVVRLLHSGILYGEGRNPEPFLKALGQVVREKREPVEVILRASGNPETHGRMASELGVSDIVRILPLTGHQEAIAEILGADGLIVFQGAVFNRQIPAKVYEYLRSGQPILALVDHAGETARLLAGWDGVYSARPESVEEIASALAAILDDVRARKAPLRSSGEVFRLSRAARTAELAAVLDEMTMA